MSKTALFPGSFDPFTLGHEAVVERSLRIFDRVIIGIGENSSKNYLFSIDQRMDIIKQAVARWDSRVEVLSYKGLTTDFCRQQSVKFIVRGIRNARDFEYEKEIEGMNKMLDANIETIMIMSAPEHVVINSTIVREIYRNRGDIAQFLPKGVKLPKQS